MRWDKLTLSLICVQADQMISDTGKLTVWNKNCRWTKTLSVDEVRKSYLTDAHTKPYLRSKKYLILYQ